MGIRQHCLFERNKNAERRQGAGMMHFCRRLIDSIDCRVSSARVHGVKGSRDVSKCRHIAAGVGV